MVHDFTLVYLRNHGFLLVPGKGCCLSETFDMNPVAGSNGLRLHVSEADNATGY